MNKYYENGLNLSQKILKGVDTLADNVGSTLGPKGRNVVIAEVVSHNDDNIGGALCRQTGRRGRALLPCYVARWADLGRRQSSAHLDGSQDRGAGVEIGSDRRDHQHYRHRNESLAHIIQPLRPANTRAIYWHLYCQ